MDSDRGVIREVAERVKLRFTANKVCPVRISATPVNQSLRCQPAIWPAIVFLVIASLVIRLWNLDLVVQSWFWTDEGGWALRKSGWVLFLYHYGHIPALTTGGVCLIICAASFFAARLQRARFLSGFLACALVLGPGLLVNTTFKNHFGRPRPRQISNFDGDQEFAPLGQPTFKNHQKSFPSGHASTGFFWFAPGIYFWRHSRRLAWAFIGLALMHGGLMGFARMGQGAHWLSDIVWSGGIVYLSSWVLYRALAWCVSRRDVPEHGSKAQRLCSKTSRNVLCQ